MRHLCCTVAVLTLIQVSSVAAGQQSAAHAFGEFKTQVLERVEGKGVPRAPLSQVFGLPDDMLVIRAAEVAFRDQHRLSLILSVNSTDMFLAESKNTPTGTVLSVFHTDLSLALRAAAAGADLNSLQVVSADEVSSQFRDVLATWERHLPLMLERARKKAARQ